MPRSHATLAALVILTSVTTLAIAAIGYGVGRRERVVAIACGDPR